MNFIKKFLILLNVFTVLNLNCANVEQKQSDMELDLSCIPCEQYFTTVFNQLINEKELQEIIVRFIKFKGKNNEWYQKIYKNIYYHIKKHIEPTIIKSPVVKSDIKLASEQLKLFHINTIEGMIYSKHSLELIEEDLKTPSIYPLILELGTISDETKKTIMEFVNFYFNEKFQLKS